MIQYGTIIADSSISFKWINKRASGTKWACFLPLINDEDVIQLAMKTLLEPYVIEKAKRLKGPKNALRKIDFVHLLDLIKEKKLR